MTARRNRPKKPRAPRLADEKDAGPYALLWGDRADGRDSRRPLLLLHGLPQLPTIFALLAGLLGWDYWLIAPYLYGHLYKRPKDYQLEHLVDNALAVADHYELEHFDVVGIGLGAVVAWMLAARCPERVRMLVCIHLWHPVAADAMALGGEALTKPVLRELLIKLGLPRHRVDVYVTRMSAPGALPAALALHARQPLELPWLTVPVLLVANEGDDPAALDRIQQRAALGSVQVALLNRGTRFPLENASPELLPLLQRYLLQG